MTDVTTPRGRAGKRAAILAAGFAVFARAGYTQAGVQEIADEANIAKPTVYSHFGDKEDLFRQAMAASADAVLAENLAALERLRAGAADLRAAFDAVAYQLVRVCCGERARALRWLTYGQSARFPDLIGDVQERTATRLRDAVADRLARLAVAGELRRHDPMLAADQFLALLTGPMEARSRMGTRTVAAADMRAVASAAADTFLRAYGPHRLMP
ncbi:TetR/AcrR family transcriptional regulator [Actinophytocola sediminis]